MRIRAATPHDAPAIQEVVVSVGGSIPWDDAEECRHHIEWMLQLGALPVVAEAQGTVVGEMEMWRGPDVPELGTSLDITMLNVHADRQQRGIGHELVAYALAVGRQEGVDCCCVWTDRDAVGFYRKQGFEEGLSLSTFCVDPTTVRTPAGGASAHRELASLPEPAGEHLQTHRILHPRLQWHTRVEDERHPPSWQDRDGGPAPPLAYVIDVAGHEGSSVAVFRPAYWTGDRDRAEFCLWSPVRERDVLAAAISQAARMGIRDLRTCAYGRMADLLTDFGARATDRQQVLVRRPAIVCASGPPGTTPP